MSGLTDSLWEELGQVAIVDVVVGVEAPDLQPSYSYSVPERLLGELHVGTCVHVPFGGRDTHGYVMEVRTIARNDPLVARLREIIAIVEGAVTFGKDQAETARWIAERYVCDLSDAVKCIAPSALTARIRTAVRLTDLSVRTEGCSMVQAHIIETLRSLGGEADLEDLRKAAQASAFSGSYAALIKRGTITESREVARPRVSARKVRAYALGPAVDSLSGKPSQAAQRILAALAQMEKRGETPVLPEKLMTAAQAGQSAIKTLVDKGAVIVRELDVRRRATELRTDQTVAPTLTPGQQTAADKIGQMVESGESSTALLFGVTASGKTEVYLNAIARTLESNRSAIVLLPEIALTTQVVDIFTGRFGDEVAVLHSKLSDGERHDEWKRLQDSKARIAVGARSAVFAPVENVGLIVVDEEHEPSYKQENQPRYNARDVACERARISRAAVVLGSATPSLETYYATEQGAIDRIEMPERVSQRPLPTVELVDMREELREHKSLFSRRLIEDVGDRLARGKQVILFLNRRGYSQFILCRDCGYVARCPNCAVSLAFHAAWSALRCHHCDYSRSAPSICPQCKGTRIKGFGVGTEKVEEETLKFFPDARVARLDRDTTSRKGAHAGILGSFRRGDADILIGTQMVAKGLDFPNVTLVGVISADTSINVPDFRAAERTFQLLTQVAGRAGRGDDPGEVIIQTFGPEHYALQMTKTQDFRGFYDKEIEFRRELTYPPFSRLANLICTDEDSKAVRDRAHQLAAAVKEVVPEDVEVIGPAAAPLSKLKTFYRWHVVVRAPVGTPLPNLIREALSRLDSSDRRRITVDVDPLNMA